MSVWCMLGRNPEEFTILSNSDSPQTHPEVHIHRLYYVLVSL